MTGARLSERTLWRMPGEIAEHGNTVPHESQHALCPAHPFSQHTDSGPRGATLKQVQRFGGAQNCNTGPLDRNFRRTDGCRDHPPNLPHQAFPDCLQARALVRIVWRNVVDAPCIGHGMNVEELC